jgi:hypothetical protein
VREIGRGWNRCVSQRMAITLRRRDYKGNANHEDQSKNNDNGRNNDNGKCTGLKTRRYER